MKYKILYGIPSMFSHDYGVKKHLNKYGHVVDYEYNNECFDLWCDFKICSEIKENKKCIYTMSFETFIGFDEEDGCKTWIRNCLECFTNYMINNDYDTSKELSLYEVFTEGINVNTEFKDIETMYAFMKFVVNGFNGKALW